MVGREIYCQNVTPLNKMSAGLGTPLAIEIGRIDITSATFTLSYFSDPNQLLGVSFVIERE